MRRLDAALLLILLNIFFAMLIALANEVNRFNEIWNGAQSWTRRSRQPQAVGQVVLAMQM